jgi:PAS domain S-box-containing protein
MSGRMTKINMLLSNVRPTQMDSFLLASIAVIYAAAFFLLLELIGLGGAILALTPIVMIIWFYGAHTALLAGFITFPIYIVLIELARQLSRDRLLDLGSVAGALSILLIAVIIIRLRYLNIDRQTLQHDAVQQDETRRALTRHNQALEQEVAERTLQLQRVKERVEAILHYTSDAIVLINTDGSIQQTNPAFTRLLGYDNDEAFRHALVALMEEDRRDQFSAAVDDVKRNGDDRRIEATFVHKDGHTLTVDLALAPVPDDAYDQPHIICSLRDITERKQMEENLLKALERERDLSELQARFVSTMSHEFRTPLAVINSASDVLREYGDRLSAEQKLARIDKIQNQVKHMTDLLSDILTIRKVESSHIDFNPERVDLETFCDALVQDMKLAMNDSYKFQIECEGQCEEIFADKKLLHNMIENLLTNAVKYSDAGSTIRLQLSSVDDLVSVSVADEGIGIPEHDLKNIFSPFHRAENVGNISGTGLGLAIVKYAAERHNGTVTCESEVGVGTTFTLSWRSMPNLSSADEDATTLFEYSA